MGAGAITDLWKSERGLLCVALIIGATVLVALKDLPATEWIEFAKWISVVFVGGKTVTSAVETMATRAAAAPVSSPTSAPAPAPEPATTSSRRRSS